MSDEGFKLQVSYTTPPVAQYAKGNMLNVRADTVAELAALLDEAQKRPELAQFFTPTLVGPVVSEEDQAEAAFLKHLGPGQELASATQIAAAAAVSGKTIEELQGISKAEAKALITGGK